MDKITLGDISTCVLFLVALLGGIGTLFKYLEKWIGKAIEKQLKPNTEANKCLLRSNITSKYYVYTQLGEIPMYEKENCNYMHQQYKAMGGNSYIDEIMEELNQLPIKK